MRYTRRLAGMSTATALALGLMTTTVEPAQAAATHYVALGDSYASGTGTRDYFDNSGSCLRSPKAYPQLWSESHHAASFHFDACSSATTDDLNADQLGSLNRDTTLVTVSIGGNDIGFAGTVARCLISDDGGCDAAVGESEAKARDELPKALDTTYGKIASAAPNAKVVVLGYPRLNAPTGSCDVPGFSATKRQRINAGANVLAGVIAEHAEAAGFRFADPREKFDGHGVCGSSAWINGPSTPLHDSFHPNVDGHAKGLLPVLNAVTG